MKAMKGIGGGKDVRIQSMLDAIVIQGQDIAAHAHLRSAVFPSKMLPADKGGGRWLDESDRGKNRIVISKKIARDFPIKGDDGKDAPGAWATRSRSAASRSRSSASMTPGRCSWMS